MSRPWSQDRCPAKFGAMHCNPVDPFKSPELGLENEESGVKKHRKNDLP